LLDFNKSVYLQGSNTQGKLEIASLTKMYTFYACLMLNDYFYIHPTKIIVKIFNCGIGGTSAELQADDYLSLMDLYYAMMLPSGNDAAYILASYYGCWLYENRKQQPYS